MESVGIGIFDIDLKAEIAYASPTLLSLAGIPASSQALSFSIWQKYLPQQTINENLAIFGLHSAARAKAYEREISIPYPDGKNLGMLMRARIEYAGKRPVRIHGTCVDVTERKMIDTRLTQTQTQLSQRLDDLNHLHELSIQLLEKSDLKSQLELLLHALTRFHGARAGLASLYDTRTDSVEPGASLGIDGQALVHAHQSGSSACAAACRTRTRVVIEKVESDPRLEEYRDLLRGQGFRSLHSTPLISPQGEVLGALTILLSEPRRPTARECALADICARKAVMCMERSSARKELLDSQGRFETVLDASGAPFVILAPVRNNREIINFRWTYVNRAAACALNQQPRELLGREVLGTLSAMSPESPGFCHCTKALETRHTVEFNTVNGKGAQARWFHCIASPIHDSVAIWFTDISERIRNEQSLRHSDRRKDEFLATLAHELRNPLAPIYQAAQLLMSPDATDAQRHWASEVTHRQVRRMSLLLDDLLDVPRISRGTLILRKSLANIDDIIASAIEMARPNIDSRSHRLSVHGSTTPIAIEADNLRLAQVVANLLNNAAKYTDPGGSIDLTVSRQNSEVVIEVRDDGIGLPAAAIPEVFRMFSQLRHAGNRTGSGLGIGLALSKGLVELHGGTLSAHSDGFGKGSIFTVRLPQGQVEQPPPPDETPPPLPPRSCKILIADDNRDAQDTFAALLALDGHEVHHAYDGDEALALWQRIRPDVCLLDIGMPGRDGYQVAREIRAAPGGQTCLLVAVTGWGQARDRQASLEAGFDHHLTKPVDPAQINQLLAARSSPPAGMLFPDI